MKYFEYCKFCHGKGCLACTAERKKYEEQRTKDIKNWQPPNEESISI